MRTSPVDWLGNRVVLHPIAGTDLTVVQWWRPHHGAQRGARVLDTRDLAGVGRQLEHLRRLRDRGDVDTSGYLRRDLAGCPVILERLLNDMLGSRDAA